MSILAQVGVANKIKANNEIFSTSLQMTGKESATSAACHAILSRRNLAERRKPRTKVGNPRFFEISFDFAQDDNSLQSSTILPELRMSSIASLCVGKAVGNDR
jgi:hypothetical protein